MSTNPFSIASHGARGPYGRLAELRHLESIIETGGSAVLWCSLPNGRSELLQMLLQRLAQTGRRAVLLAAETLPPDVAVEAFWSRIQRGIGLDGDDSSPSDLQIARPAGHSVVLIDDLDRVVRFDSLARPDVWGKLRGLTQHGGISVIATSSVDTIELNQLTSHYNYGSPFFNGMRSIPLHPLHPAAVQEWLDDAGRDLAPEDRTLIKHISGGCPGILRFLGADLWESQTNGPHHPTGAREAAVNRCLRAFSGALETAWTSLNPPEQWLVLRITLAQRCQLPLVPAEDSAAARSPGEWRPPGGLRRLLERMHRVEMCDLLDSIAKTSVRQHLPPLETTAGITFFDAAVDYIERHNMATSVFDELWQRLPASRSEIASTAAAWEWSPPTALAIEATTADLLQHRGLLDHSSAPTGWQVGPFLFHCWLLDRIGDLARTSEPPRWLSELQLQAGIPPRELHAFLALIHENSALLSPGAPSAIQVACRESRLTDLAAGRPHEGPPKPRNPFIVGTSVGGTSAFVGRMTILLKAESVLSQSQQAGLILFGQRRIGKTSILQQLLYWLPTRGAWHPVFFDLQGRSWASIEEILNDLASAISYVLACSKPVLGTDVSREFRQEWLPGVLKDVPGRLVILFDEFDVIADSRARATSERFFRFLNDIFEDPVMQTRISFIFAMGRSMGDLDVAARPLLRSFRVEYVSTMTRDELDQLLDLATRDGGLQWHPSAREEVWEATSGHPLLAQLIASEAWHNESGGAKVIERDHIRGIVSRALTEARSMFAWMWDGIPVTYQTFATILAARHGKPASRDAIYHAMRTAGNETTAQQVYFAALQLRELDILDETDGLYRFKVEMFRRWIEVYHPSVNVREEHPDASDMQVESQPSDVPIPTSRPSAAPLPGPPATAPHASQSNGLVAMRPRTYLIFIALLVLLLVAVMAR